MTRTAKISNVPTLELPPSEDAQQQPRRKQVVYRQPQLTSTSQAPDGGWGWFVVLGSALTHVVIGKFLTCHTSSYHFPQNFFIL